MKDEESKSMHNKGTKRAVTKFSEEYFIPPSKKEHYLIRVNDKQFAKTIIEAQQERYTIQHEQLQLRMTRSSATITTNLTTTPRNAKLL